MRRREGPPRGTLDGIGLSHEQIGRLLGITGARVQQIEAKALRKLREAAREQGLGDLFSESDGRV